MRRKACCLFRSKAIEQIDLVNLLLSTFHDTDNPGKENLIEFSCNRVEAVMYNTKDYFTWYLLIFGGSTVGVPRSI